MGFIIPERFERDDTVSTFQRFNHPTMDHPETVRWPQGVFISQQTKNLLGEQTAFNAGTYVNIINYTDKPIFILDRWNCIQRIAPAILDDFERQRIDEYVQIEIVQFRPSHLNEQGDRVFDLYGSNMQKGRSAIRDAWYKRNHPHEPPTHVVSRVTVIQIRDMDSHMDRYRGSFYHHESGYVFIDERSPDIIVHPDTPESELMQLITFIPDAKTFDLEVMVNDPKNEYAVAYINVGGKIFQVPIQRSAKEKAGIYVTRQSGGGRNQYDPVHEYYEFDSPDNHFRIFKSKSEARSFGDPIKSLEHDTIRLKNETQKVKAETESLETHKRTVEREAEHRSRLDEIELDKKRKEAEIELETKRKQLEAERAAAAAAETKYKRLQEEEQRKQNAKMQKADFSRKMLVEGAKLITTVVTTALSLFAWYKLKSG